MVIKELEKVDTFYHNKTFKYLSHSLRWYGHQLIRDLGNFGKVKAMCIADEDRQYPFPILHLVFRLENLKLNDFNKYEEKLKYYKDAFVDSYHLGDLQSKLHCIVLKVSENAEYAYKCFLTGAYSEMYTRKELDALFVVPPIGDQYNFERQKMVLEAHNVCIKSAQTKLALETKISGDAGWITIPEDAELDSKPEPNKEIINYKSLNLFK